MDYSSIHGPGISNFSSPSPHRLPTISAAQALQDLTSSPTRCISTSLSQLDSCLQGRLQQTQDTESLIGGISRGKVTELYGPPGVGKTTLGIHLACSVLYAGDGVLWVDGSHPVSGLRFSQILSASRPVIREANVTEDLLNGLSHVLVPTLAHLVALLSQPTINHPAKNLNLIVVDSFSTLISAAFPRSIDVMTTTNRRGAPNTSARKASVLQFIINALQKIAATHNIAVVVLSQCITKMRPGAGAALVPAVNTTAWEQGLGCRVVLFRDWGKDNDHGIEHHDLRLAQVLKAEGTAIPDNSLMFVSFIITQAGIQGVELPSMSRARTTWQAAGLAEQHAQVSVLPQKRKVDVAQLEIPDSDGEDDEDYGWAEEDEEDVPPNPPQWQGSEDIMVPAEGEADVEEDAEVELQDDGHIELPPMKISTHIGDLPRRDEIGEIDDSEDELA